MTYVVLARKWRPQRFSDVLGQEHVTQTLTNAIRARRIAHAFLFSGPRGVGKTSAARILAKALCCTSGDGPTAEPCGTCRQCVEITEGRSTDIFEIDAASHTGVDNIREIIDNARYLPSSARFKIYVIDEVHMLSQGAFNALLKTLEEPPEHVKFVLATTDVHKVPVTVKSRCQRYDFRRIALSRIAERLSFILEEEGIAHDPSALSLVAREAEGSMRDAQSLLEQVLAFAGDRPLDPPLVREALGVVDSALVGRAREALFAHQPGPLIELVQDVHARGLDLSRFVGALVEHVRDLLAAQVVSDPKAVLDRPEDEIADLVRASKAVSAQTLERLFEQLCRIAEDVGRSSHPRFALEVGLASLAEKPLHVPLEHLVAQLDRVEGLLGGAPTGPGRGPDRGPGGGPGANWGSGGGHRRASAPASARPEPPRGAARPREPGARRSAPPAPGDADAPSDPAPRSRPQRTAREPLGSTPPEPTPEHPLPEPPAPSPERPGPEPPSPEHPVPEPAPRPAPGPGPNPEPPPGPRPPPGPQPPPGPAPRPVPEPLPTPDPSPIPPAPEPVTPPAPEPVTPPEPVPLPEPEEPAARRGAHLRVVPELADDAPPWVTEEIPLPDAPSPAGPSPRGEGGAALARAPEPPAPAEDPAEGPVWLRFEEPFAQFVGYVRKRRPALAATLMQVRPLAFGPGGVELGCETAFDFKKLEARETREVLEGMLEAHLGRAAPISVRRGTDPRVRQEKKTLIEVEDEHAAQVRRDKEASAKNDPKVNAVVQALSGTIANIRVLDG